MADPEPDQIGGDVRARLRLGALTLATDYIKAQRARSAFNAEMDDAMERHDLLIAPTVPTGAPRIGETFVEGAGKRENILSLLSRLTRPFNICGYPTVSVPCGFTSSGMPIGMQIAGRPFEDAAVLRAAHASEQATEGHKRRPAV